MSRERPGSFVLSMAQTESSVKESLEPGNCKVESSALLLLPTTETMYAGGTRKISHWKQIWKYSETIGL